MLFVVTAIDKTDSLQLRLSVREQHFAFAKETGRIRLGGPFLDAKGEMCGSLMIVEAPDLETATGGLEPQMVLSLSADDLAEAARSLSNAPDGAPLAAVTLGTPHFSLAEFARLLPLLRGEKPRVGIWINTSRATREQLRARGWDKGLAAAGVTLVVDTCAYVTTLMQPSAGVLMTNSGKCAYYAPGNLGADVVYGSLAECLASARAGKVVRL